MADPVEISNVGGYRGVASEATLLALVDAVRSKGLGGSASGNDRMVNRMQELHNRAIREGTKEVKAFDRAIEKSVEAVTDFSKELIVGGDRVSDFADALLGSQNVLARFIKFVDGTFDQFRNLTSVGASFNNSMLEMVRTSGEAFMTLDGFTEMVRNNSQALSKFGGTVTQGAQGFARFSKDFRMGVGARFFEMGITIADINEGLIGFLDIERMRTGRQLRSDAELQQGAANYLLQLDRLSKITGRQRRDLEDSLSREMQDAGMRSQLNRLDGQARENFSNALMVLNTELAGPIADGLKDLMDGVAQTDLGRALQSQVPGITQFAQEMFAGGASIEEIYSQLGSRFGPQLEKMASTFSKAQLDQMRMSGGVTAAIAEILDSSYQLNNLSEKDATAAAAEQQRRDRITSTLGRFEQAIIAVRKFLFDKFINSPFATALGSLGEYLVEVFEGTGSGTLGGAMSGLETAFNFLFGDSGIFTRAVSWFSNWIRTGGITTAFENLKNTINTFVERFTANVNSEGIMGAIGIEIGRLIDHMFGAVDDATGERSGGFFQRIFDGFVGSEFWADFKTRFFDVIFDDASAQREGETFFQTIKRLVIDRLTGVPDSGVDLMTAISNKIKDIFLGPITEISFPNGVETETRQGGLLDQFTQWLFNDENLNRGDFMAQVSEFAGNALSTTIQTFSNLLETSQPLIDAISDGFTSLFTMAYNALAGVIGIPETQTLGEWINTIWSEIQTTITNVTASITGAVDLIKQAFNLGEGGSLGDWISNTLTTLTTWKDEQIASLRRLIGTQGDESFGAFVTRTISEIQTGIQTQINETIASLRTLIGMQGTESFGDFVTRTIREIETGIETQLNLIDTRLRTFLGMTQTQTFESYITDMIGKLTTTIIDILENRIPALIEAAIQGARSALGGGTATAESIALGETGLGTLADQGALTGAYQGLLGFGDIDRERFLAEAEGGIVEGLNRMFGNMLGLGMEDWLEQKLTTLNAADIRGDQAREEVMRGLQSYIDQNYTGDERETMQRYLDTTIRETLDGIEGYATGTNGFKNFGGGTFAKLHGAEAVVPRNTPAGELLQAFYDSQNANRPAPAPSSTPSYNQTELISKLDQLNSTMSQVAEILVDQRDIQSRTMRNIKGMGTDLFRGAT